MPRLFTALEVPADIAMRLGIHRGGLPGARWIEPDAYHVTLRFLGDIDNARARDMDELLAGIERPPLDLEIGALDAFGGDRPRSVIALLAPTPALLELQAEHERLARRIGLSAETRKYTPHVTIARLSGGTASGVAEYLAAQPARPNLRFTAERFVLFSSRQSTGGGPYVTERAYPLDAGMPSEDWDDSEFEEAEWADSARS